MAASSNVSRASLAAAILAAGLLVLIVANPAEAAFPGKNGKIAFATVTVNSAGSNYDISRMSANQMKDEYAPAWSPDGRKIAFVSNIDPSGNGNKVDLEVWVYERGVGQSKQLTDNTVDEIYTMISDGTRQRRITNNTGVDDYEPDLSPNGAKIAFTSDRANSEGEI